MRKYNTTKHRKRTKKQRANRRARLLRERELAATDYAESKEVKQMLEDAGIEVEEELSPARQAFKDV